MCVSCVVPIAKLIISFNHHRGLGLGRFPTLSLCTAVHAWEASPSACPLPLPLYSGLCLGC